MRNEVSEQTVDLRSVTGIQMGFFNQKKSDETVAMLLHRGYMMYSGHIWFTASKIASSSPCCALPVLSTLGS